MSASEYDYLPEVIAKNAFGAPGTGALSIKRGLPAAVRVARGVHV